MYFSKQLFKQLFKNKTFLVLLFLLCTFTSFLFFFVRFSIDGNENILTGNPHAFSVALRTNKILSNNILLVFTVLTAFVYFMFFYRFFKSNQKQIGCLKALGYRDFSLQLCFAKFTTIYSFIALVLGFFFGYLASDILLHAYKDSYLVTDVVKGIHYFSVVIGFTIPLFTLNLVAFFTFHMIKKQEVAALILDSNNSNKFHFLLKVANGLVKLLPVKNKFPFRIAFRKPLALLLIVTSVMGFTVMFVLGYSLTLSSKKVYESQTKGHKYLFENKMDAFHTYKEESKDILYYLTTPCTISVENNIELKQEAIGLTENNSIYELYDKNHHKLLPLSADSIYISPYLYEMYSVKLGDTISVSIDRNIYNFKVDGIVENAKSNAIFLSKNKLSKILGLPKNTYNGMLSIDNIIIENATTITNSDKIDMLERDSVSNKLSAIINQSIGCVIGCILIYLALLLNFQDNMTDMLILKMIGYKKKEIRKLLVNVYKPIVWIAFLITLYPSIFIAKNVQKSLSIQTGDYMPFQINSFVIIFIFLLLNILYFIVQGSFRFRMGRIGKEENMSAYLNHV